MLGRIAALPLPAGLAGGWSMPISATREAAERKVLKESPGKAAISGFGILRRDKD